MIGVWQSLHSICSSILVAVWIWNVGNRLANKTAEFWPPCTRAHIHHQQVLWAILEIVQHLCVVLAIASKEDLTVEVTLAVNFLMNSMNGGLAQM